MWQLDREAMKASSGSTAAGSEKGVLTTWGELEAATTAPPSKRHTWRREYLLSTKSSCPRDQLISAVCTAILISHMSRTLTMARLPGSSTVTTPANATA